MASRLNRPTPVRVVTPALPWRMRAGILLLAIVALLPAASLTMQFAPTGWPAGDDSLAEFDRRLAPVRQHLRGERTVGYLPPLGSLEAPGGAAHFYLTRYALAPVIVVNALDQPLVIADGVDPARVPPGLVVANDFGGGLLLLRPRAP